MNAKLRVLFFIALGVACIVIGIDMKDKQLRPFYSMAKSSIHALIKSLNKIYSPRIRFFNLVPGLLKNSAMFFNMHTSLRIDHELRAGGNLMTAEEFALFLYRFVSDNCRGSNFEIGYEVDIKVGPQYK